MEQVESDQIYYVVGFPDGGTGATFGTMAMLTFTATAEVCDFAGLAALRASNPPTRISDENDDSYSLGANLSGIDLAAITIYDTPTTISEEPESLAAW